MAVQLLYFAWVREAIGRDGERVELPGDITDVAGLIGWLAMRGGGYATAFAEPQRLRCAIDQNFAGLATPIAGAREIAIFPPVTGG
ncbi:molybdopterin converting factor subunit 1 [Sphingomonas abietis]|uniref:Molybdopterin converting factor subunit 1 n=1 Tax=Sphingomonas abietis TaxID=3012344 RepID=A0ABY7NQH4_9SPHN|nr:molybdopterin converting factor subunit 1 [Sphingomonas abietis]WBO23447.1 molybdopterin converting factor subunit 1 [Sphingomonas abietis]